MKHLIVMVIVMLLGACATTYNLPIEERSRSYEASSESVWEAAIQSVDDAELSLIETEKEHGRIRARSRGSVWDFKGHMLLVVVQELGSGQVRVNANAETTSKDKVVDFGMSKRIVRDYLSALDRRMNTRG
ncbi:MAG: hypothetical protein HKN13_08980 [Rhodothermales bacterium]|nr:hypothetical protein [Rhodothermales bacterium]